MNTFWDSIHSRPKREECHPWRCSDLTPYLPEMASSSNHPAPFPYTINASLNPKPHSTHAKGLVEQQAFQVSHPGWGSESRGWDDCSEIRHCSLGSGDFRPKGIWEFPCRIRDAQLSVFTPCKAKARSSGCSRRRRLE